MAIAGLHIIDDFIAPDDERSLINLIDQHPWDAGLQRRVQHYGYRYDYRARKIDHHLKLGPIPDWLQHYTQKLHHDNLCTAEPDQVIINEYQPGQGISPHIDCIPCFTDTIISLSLGSTCAMDFQHSQTHEKTAIWLKSCSLVILQNEARYLWRHSIAPRKRDVHGGCKVSRGRRISLTFRKVSLS